MQLGLAHANRVATMGQLTSWGCSGNVTLRRIHKLVSACSKGRFVARDFRLPFDGDDLSSQALDLVGRQYRCFNSPIGDSLKDLQRHRTIDPHSADADT